MALIRSEHINDQAVREAKDSVANSESALEDARAQLEKRERAQYHEEQIWSDTIRRNSTWVTFGLMGVNIFLLLLSLAILEPWRRRRMVREIKDTLEAQQKVAMEAAAAPALVAVGAPTVTHQNLAAAEEVIDRAIEPTEVFVEAAAPAVVEEVVKESPSAGTVEPAPIEPEVVPIAMPQSAFDPQSEPTVSAAVPVMAEEAEVEPQESTNVPEEVTPSQDMYSKLETWQEKATFIAQDIVSDRVISMPRIDYTTAILQGAAAGAVITAAIISMLRSN
jgi:sensitive to high expression protein 9